MAAGAASGVDACELVWRGSCVVFADALFVCADCFSWLGLRDFGMGVVGEVGAAASRVIALSTAVVLRVRYLGIGFFGRLTDAAGAKCWVVVSVAALTSFGGSEGVDVGNVV